MREHHHLETHMTYEIQSESVKARANQTVAAALYWDRWESKYV